MKKHKTIEAIKKAILIGQSHYKNIALPSSQGTGTCFQQNTYAYLQAQKLYKAHFENNTNNLKTK